MNIYVNFPPIEGDQVSTNDKPVPLENIRNAGLSVCDLGDSLVLSSVNGSRFLDAFEKNARELILRNGETFTFQYTKYIVR